MMGGSSAVRVGLVLCLVGVSSSAFAHALLVSSQPAAGSKVIGPLKQIRLQFNEVPESAFSEITVSDAASLVVANGKGTGLCEAKVCTLILPSLKLGKYTVAFRVLSVDGHVVKGTYAFSLVPQVP
jgi:copper resistance protein C